MNRRTFLKSLAAVPLAAAATGLYTWQIEPYWVEYVYLPMPIHNLPDALSGRTLVQISDIHVGNRFDWNFLIRELKKVQELAPDFVVYTGDFVSYENEEQFAQLREVLQEAALGTLGTVGILGNHDYGHGWSQPKVAREITAIANDAGIQMLRNESRSIAGLTVTGLDDFWGSNFRPQPALAQVQTSDANLVLSHNPDVMDQPVWEGYRGWVLSGHTHGGQCKPPFLPPPMLPINNKRYTAGKFDFADGRTLYINRALGNLWPVRFNVRPEVTVFRLEAAF